MNKQYSEYLNEHKELSRYEDYLVSNKYGMAVSFLRAHINGMFVPKYSYHLHFLLSYDKEIDSLFILCLDQGTFITIDNYYDIIEKGEEEAHIDGSIIELSEDFIDQVWQNVNAGGTKKGYLFRKQNQKLWNAFNKIKQDFFVDSVNEAVVRRDIENENFFEFKEEEKKIEVINAVYRFGTEAINKYTNKRVVL